MKIKFYGGAAEVGRSCIYLEEDGKNMILDCGIKLGTETQYPLIPEEELRGIKDIFITHAHLDHSGYLPHVYESGARPKIFATKPTRDLAGVLLSDYRRIHKGNKFRQKDVDAALQNIDLVEFTDTTKSQFEFTIHNAGHILGSAMIRVNTNNGILYSGDICMRKTRTLDSCEKGIPAETLIVENTYGGKDDVIPSFKDSYQKLMVSINQTIKEGGWVLIPSFAVGRAQEILLTLDDYMRSGILTPVKIYVDGMITKAMRIYRHNAYYANDDIKKRILMSEDDPFNSKMFYQPKTKTREDVFKEPAIIVSTSGMLSGGPALTYLERMAPDPKNKIIFSGYQAEGTLGRKILSGEKNIKIGENEVELRLKVEEARISGHADYSELLQFVRSVKGLKKVFLVHGEEGELNEALEKDYEVFVPKLLDEFEI
ncbi:MBL fold metallo-hydrolase [Candidatus Micrarchaeota archaeon]|nr:MBL fold metallo-hydrolase [Candidatus Micrarchaeota archaeon]